MNLEARHHSWIAGPTTASNAALRAALSLAEVPYRLVVALRNASFDRSGPSYRAPVPVISIGNLTVGGTGKTPMVMEIVQRLQRLGVRPAVLARGYGSAGADDNDEQRLIRRRCPGVACFSDPNRQRAAEQAVRGERATALVLDDGFQHRRVARNLDIVLVDAGCAFGFGRLLPRGLLREPVTNLRRADLIVMTRIEQVDADALRRIESELRAVTGEVPVIRASHCVAGVVRLDGSALADGALEGRNILAVCGIARPDAFRRTLESLGANLREFFALRDHHAYTACDVERLADALRSTGADFVVTTEKDAVKLESLKGVSALPVAVVRVAIRFAAHDSAVLEQMLTRALGRSADSDTAQPDAARNGP